MDKYEKLRVVGRGAYGIVHLCRRISDKKLVIIKQIPVEQMTKEERQSALNEVIVLSMLHHPNIIEYYENFLEDKALMIVMEYAQGGTLLEYLQSRGNHYLEEEDILQMFAQMLLSLQHVHSKQILHRDLKTQNILLDKRREVVKIGDFGISKVLSSKSKAYTVVGTPYYLSPELCEGKPYNQKSDIWALGCVLYELASLKRAFEAANLPALILKIMRGTFAPISDHYSEELRLLILSMLHLDPNKRPTINQIMAAPIVINALVTLHTDMGKIPCSRVQRPLSSLPSSARSRVSNKGNASSRGGMAVKPQALSSVFYWGGGIINTPEKLTLPSSDTQVVQVAAGRTQKAAVTKNGRLFVWESSGVGSYSPLPGAVEWQSAGTFLPRYLEGQSAVTIQHVACGDLFTACLTDRGILMTFGSGANGCLGHGNFNDVSQVDEARVPRENLDKLCQLSIFITPVQAVLCLNTQHHPVPYKAVDKVPQPGWYIAKIVEALLGYEVIQISCGASHVLAVTNEHEVFAWGRGDNGRLGLGNEESFSSPQQVSIPENLSPCSVHCGVDCSMIVTLGNGLLGCGSNRYNKLGLDEYTEDGTCTKVIEEIHTFTMVTAPLSKYSIKSVAMGTSHTAVITVDGQCVTFGSNQFGQLGYESQDGIRQPQDVKTLQSYHVDRIACGDTFTVCVTQDAEIFSWGKSSRGRLGRSGEDTVTPHPVVFPVEDMFTVVSISCSHGNTLVATKPLQEETHAVD